MYVREPYDMMNDTVSPSGSASITLLNMSEDEKKEVKKNPVGFWIGEVSDDAEATEDDTRGEDEAQHQAGPAATGESEAR